MVFRLNEYRVNKPTLTHTDTILQVEGLLISEYKHREHFKF